MKSQKGIALITSLLVMVVVMTLGVGALSLSIMNSKIAENTRSAAIAEANAETGITAAIIALNTSFNTSTTKKFPQSTLDNKFPSSFSIPTIDGVAAFAAADYVYITNSDQSSYTLTVKGRTASGGLHQSEGLVGTAAGLSVNTKFYGKGLVSEGTVEVTGGGNSTYYDAIIHGNGGFKMAGFNYQNVKKCTSRSTTTGGCLEGTMLANTAGLQGLSGEAYNSALAAQLPIYGGTTATLCNASSVVCASSGPRNKQADVVIDLTYTKARDAAIAASDVTKATPPRIGDIRKFAGISCDKTYSTMPGALSTASAVKTNFLGNGSYKVICVEGGDVTLPAGVDLTGVTIIAQDTINFNGTPPPTLNESQLISLNGGINISGDPAVINSKIFSKNDLNLSSSASSYEGDTTLASAGSISVKGVSRATKNNASGEYTLGVSFIADGNVTLGGNGNAEWFASIIPGGTTSISGSSILHGGITSKANISFSGGMTLDSNLSVSNTSVQGTSTPTPIILSRR